MAREKDIELVSKVWIEERKPFGALTDDFVKKFLKMFVDQNLLCKFYRITAPIDMIRQYHNQVSYHSIINVLTVRKFPENILC